MLDLIRKWTKAVFSFTPCGTTTLGNRGGGDDDEPVLPKPKSPAELMSEQAAWMQGEFPEYYGTREWGAGQLKQIPSFDIAPIEYEKFGPTSFEEALGTRYFENVWPETERAIKHGLSLSGMAYSPVLGAQLGKARGGIEYDIGRYLSELGEQRAVRDYERRLKEMGAGEEARQFAISQAMGTQPMEYLPQWQQQEQNRYTADLMEYQKALKEYEKGKMGGTWGSLIGMGVGAIAAPFTGGLSLIPAMALGGGLGGMIGKMGWGGEPGVSMADALSIYQTGQEPSIEEILKAIVKAEVVGQ